ncbi:BrxE family protein [Marinobacterium sp. YM272]|uniref:BrxE family protein n=1 Tax=Marinobacterium sp. YM272 TaxID=3421654 RepID=UPI003D7FAF56
MNKDVIKQIADLRIVVGFLGEKSQRGWWSCSFLAPQAKNFLTPIFPRTLVQAQHRGVTAAATLVHDDVIGVGATYHLFRMPESIELELDRLFQSAQPDQYTAVLTDEQSALERLQAMAGGEQTSQEGPVIVGDYDADNLPGLIQQVAGQYLSAFQQDTRCYPFMREIA